MIPFALPGCVVTGTTSCDQTLVIDAQATTTAMGCPTCQQRTTRVHSRYLRTPRDLPVSTQRVQLRLVVRRFFCDHPACPRKTFAETLPDLLPRKAQRTARLTATLYDLGAEAGGTSGAHLAKRIRIQTSPDTIVRILRQHAPAMTSTPRVLGVDDFALQKGRIYGTILVDHERGAPIDLLPDRKPETLATWLHEHPGVEIITRDRSTEFTRGATDGAPDAIQVADRWHVLTNLRAAVERMLQRRMPELTRLLAPAGAATTPSAGRPRFPQRISAQVRDARQARREQRAQRYQTIQALTTRGMNILQIADYLQISRQTVRRYRAATEVPEPAPPRPAPSQLAPYVPWLEQQWAAGSTNAAALTRTLQDSVG
jgi:transposase